MPVSGTYYSVPGSMCTCGCCSVIVLTVPDRESVHKALCDKSSPEGKNTSPVCVLPVLNWTWDRLCDIHLDERHRDFIDNSLNRHLFYCSGFLRPSVTSRSRSRLLLPTREASELSFECYAWC